MPAEPTSPPCLAAVCYGSGGGERADRVLATVPRILRGAGIRLAGAVQHNSPVADRCRCDMALEDLGSGQIVSISEDRGPGAQGCRLDSGALEEIVGMAGAALEAGADLLIVNKFGKREAEGRGFRQVIEAAVARGLPVLVAVGPDNLAAWQAFAAGLDERLPPELERIERWCRSVVLARRSGADPLPLAALTGS